MTFRSILPLVAILPLSLPATAQSHDIAPPSEVMDIYEMYLV